MDIHAHSKLVMIGNSITDCDRARPVGKGAFGATGQGYVSLVEALLGARYPALGIDVVNMGVSGNTVRDLKARWQGDVLDLQPNWLSIKIGINDVWRQFDTPLKLKRHVPLPEYERTLNDLVCAVAPLLKGLVLMTPYLIEANRADPMRAMMDEYSDVVRGLARRYGAHLADTQAAFDEVLTHVHPMSLAWDRIHPNRIGHMILARTFLNAVGYSWN